MDDFHFTDIRGNARAEHNEEAGGNDMDDNSPLDYDLYDTEDSHVSIGGTVPDPPFSGPTVFVLSVDSEHIGYETHESDLSAVIANDNGWLFFTPLTQLKSSGYAEKIQKSATYAYEHPDCDDSVTSGESDAFNYRASSAKKTRTTFKT